MIKREFRTFSAGCFTENNYASLLHWAQKNFDNFTLLNSNNHKLDPWSGYDAIFAAGASKSIQPEENKDAFEILKRFTSNNHDWLFGFFSYDLKNQLEDLKSENFDGIKMPLMHFFLPDIVLLFSNGKVEMGILQENSDLPAHAKLMEDICRFHYSESESLPLPVIQNRVSSDEYISTANQIIDHIRKGDIYEANYCIEFFAEDCSIDPVQTFITLNSNNPSPFSCIYKLKDKYLLSSSPERFMAKRGKKLISQPIKGTIRRGTTAQEDLKLKTQLFNDPKERSENVMIVDLVRNDLSRTAEKGTVNVEELFGIYTYPKVHQMISTVTSLLRADTHFVDAIREAFPMGSMTGAPKIRAMQLMEHYETSRRGLYSGTVGYITPCCNFDFNVIIRSILYNESGRYVSVMAGSAITAGSDPQKEYDECLLKASSMLQSLGVKGCRKAGPGTN